MLKHPILKQLFSYSLREKQLAIVWLGQNGFLIRSRDCVILIDPYLSDFAEQWTYGRPNEHIRMSAIPIQPKEIQGVDYVLCTHDHVDHIDPFTIPIIALRNPQTQFIAPKVSRTRMLGLYVEENQLKLMSGKDSLILPQITVHAIPAAHHDLSFDQVNGYHFLSYLVEMGGVTFFHAGDTVFYQGQTEMLENVSVDLAFLPINGKQPEELNLEPNFTIGEAISFANKIAAKVVIPMHYDMFTLNTANITDFVLQANNRVNYRIAQIGKPFLFPR